MAVQAQGRALASPPPGQAGSSGSAVGMHQGTSRTPWKAVMEIDEVTLCPWHQARITLIASCGGRP